VVVRRLEVLTGVGGRRRWWSDDKARIVDETLAPGATVSEVAQRHDIRPQQLRLVTSCSQRVTRRSRVGVHTAASGRRPGSLQDPSSVVM
jgi:transposase-like protein